MAESATGGAATGAASGAAAGSIAGPWGAVIGAAIGLVGGLLGSASQRSDEAKRRKLEGEMAGFQTQSNANAAMTAGEQGAFGQMMQGYANTLVR